MYQVKPYDGIAELLAELKRKGFKLCVLSNKPHEETENVIHTLFGENVFDVVQGQTDGIPIKPDPTAALRIAEGLAIKPGILGILTHLFDAFHSHLTSPAAFL